MEAQTQACPQGIALFTPPVAAEIRRLFGQGLDAGLTVAEAARQIAQRLGERLREQRDMALAITVLAALELERGALEPGIREKARLAIKSGLVAGHWSAAEPEVQAQVRQFLNDMDVILAETWH